MEIPQLTKLQKKEIDEVLTAFGLNKKDQKVYLKLLQAGQTTITPLARSMSLPVTTVQSVLSRLADTGLADISKQKSKNVYEANDPLVLKKILETRMKEVADIVPFLKQLKTEPMVSPKIRVYYRERIADIFDQSLKCKSKLVYEIVSAQDFQDVIGEKYHYTRRRIKNGVRLKSLRVESREIKKYNKRIHGRELREAKFLPRELTFQCSISFWDNTVAFFTTKNEGVHFTIESKTLRETFEQIFELLWSVSRRMETLDEEAKNV